MRGGKIQKIIAGGPLQKMGNNISGRTDAWVNLFSLEILLSVPFPRKCKYAETFLGNMGAVGHRPRFSLVPEKWEHRFHTL